jgi:tetratricopeptide (TPR) repeat protein
MEKSKNTDISDEGGVPCAMQDGQELEDLNKAIELVPQLAVAYNNRGVSYSKKGDYNLALQDLNKAIELDPQDAWAYGRRGNVYFNQKDSGRALRIMKKHYSWMQVCNG